MTNELGMIDDQGMYTFTRPRVYLARTGEIRVGGPTPDGYALSAPVDDESLAENLAGDVLHLDADIIVATLEGYEDVTPTCEGGDA